MQAPPVVMQLTMSMSPDGNSVSVQGNFPPKVIALGMLDLLMQALRTNNNSSNLIVPPGSKLKHGEA